MPTPGNVIGSPGRRDLLKLSLLAAVGSGLASAGMAAPAGAAEAALLPDRPEPVVDARFPHEIASGVFLLPDRRIPLVPNIGIVVGRDSVLVVDSGLEIGGAEALLDVVRRLAPGRRIILTVTHAHPEHGFGAQVFERDARIFYNAAQRDYFARSGATLLDGFRSSVLPASYRHLLDGIRLVPPHDVYTDSTATIDLGGRQVHFQTWGTAHTPGDQIVHLPAEGIVFTGDLVEERMFPIIPLFTPMIAKSDIDLARWETMLHDTVALQPKIVVPGHGNLGGPEIVTAVSDYFTTIRGLASAPNASTASLRESIRARYPAWENPEYIDPALNYLRS